MNKELMEALDILEKKKTSARIPFWKQSNSPCFRHVKTTLEKQTM